MTDKRNDGIIEILRHKYKIAGFNKKTGAITVKKIKQDSIFKRILNKKRRSLKNE